MNLFISPVFTEPSHAGISDISSMSTSANLEALRRLLWLLLYIKKGKDETLSAESAFSTEQGERRGRGGLAVGFSVCVFICVVLCYKQWRLQTQ